ncbi:MAG TPA: hypothetical protein VKT73_07315 [Xanthobacteraceae bacterium]|nr:hypothetical protein [Xanthobacteraceae bacterium]
MTKLKIILASALVIATSAMASAQTYRPVTPPNGYSQQGNPDDQGGPAPDRGAGESGGGS